MELTKVGKKEIDYHNPNRCPCCDRKMWKLESGQWAHLISVKLEEAYKKDKQPEE